jgi:hypothetical protein
MHAAQAFASQRDASARVHSRLSIHSTHVVAPVLQTLPAWVQRSALTLVHSTQAPAPPHTGVASKRAQSADAVQPVQVRASQRGAPARVHAALVSQATQAPAAEHTLRPSVRAAQSLA